MNFKKLGGSLMPPNNDKIKEKATPAPKFVLPRLEKKTMMRKLLENKNTFSVKGINNKKNVVSIETEIEKYNLEDRFSTDTTPSFVVQDNSFSIDYKHTYIVVKLFTGLRVIRIYDMVNNLPNTRLNES